MISKAKDSRQKKNKDNASEEGKKEKAEQDSHDARYRALFSYPETVEDLLVHAVNEPWVEEIDFSYFKKEETVWLSKRMRNKREGDSVFELKLKSGSVRYVYLFIEFQSTQDRWMALRYTLYIVLFLEHLVKQKRYNKNEKLPPVFPVVLYNGDATWRKPTQLKTLFQLDAKSSLMAYQPHFQYFLIDEGRKADNMAPSISKSIFSLESFKTKEEVPLLLEELVCHINASPSKKRLKSIMLDWVSSLFSSYQLELPLEFLDEKSESRTMFQTRMKKEIEKERYLGIEQGIEQGIERGKLEGLKEGKIEVARNMMEQGFTVAQITALTGLSIEEIEYLKH